MLKSIKIINFKSIKNMDLYFEKNINNIFGNNGVGKTNILESIGLVFGNIFFNSKLEDLLKIGENNLYIEAVFDNEINQNNIITFSYDKTLNKNLITLNSKKVSKKILQDNILKICNFYPITMNLFYLGPKYRRDFLDNILLHSFGDYGQILKKYNQILKNRNKLLKNIFEKKSKKEDLFFWNEEFIKLSKIIYDYRIDLINFLKKNITQNQNIFSQNNLKIDFIYKTKVDLDNVGESIKTYLDKNLDRDIILLKTHIGPHIDDFDIIVNNKSLINFASRGEIKSIIINLKLNEIKYIQNKTTKTPIVLIDDLISELDEKHLNILIDNLEFFQIISTSIIPLKKENVNLIDFNFIIKKIKL